jgi:hypothetical protein
MLKLNLVENSTTTHSESCVNTHINLQPLTCVFLSLDFMVGISLPAEAACIENVACLCDTEHALAPSRFPHNGFARPVPPPGAVASRFLEEQQPVHWPDMRPAPRHRDRTSTWLCAKTVLGPGPKLLQQRMHHCQGRQAEL